MANTEDLQEDIQSVQGDIEKLQLELSEFSELRSLPPMLREMQQKALAEELSECHARVIRLLDRIKRLLAEIRSTDSQPSSNVIPFSLSTHANELNAQLEWLTAALKHIKNWSKAAPDWVIERVVRPAQSALYKLKSYLVPLLKRFLSKIWQIISHLLTPKEWKITGKVGTGILGLADVGIEITFGP